MATLNYQQAFTLVFCVTWSFRIRSSF